MPVGSTDWSVAPAALIDTHAHLYGRFDASALLGAAATNFLAATRAARLDEGETPPVWVLLLMQSPGEPLRERLGRSDADGWDLEQTDSTAWRAEHAVLGRLVLVEGRQFVSSEGIELLAAPLATDLDQAPLAELVQRSNELDTRPIVPWGFGKWLGFRGRVVAELLERQSSDRLLLADNGGRPRMSSEPRLLRRAARRGFQVVYGSDPLPLSGEECRAGAVGSAFRGPFDPGQASESTRKALRGALGEPMPFGHGTGLGRFLWNQARLRLPGAPR